MDRKPFDTVILNGIIAYCKTHDENEETIGVKTFSFVKKLNGEVVQKTIGEFPFSKEMEEKIHWSKSFASVQMLTGKTPIDIRHIDETKVVSMEGDVESKYYHSYSDYTGYLWTEEGFVVGGHDLLKFLRSHIGEYIHIEIDLYKE